VIANLIIIIIFSVLFGIQSTPQSTASNVFRLAILIPSLAITTRRLHDIDKRGWWQLLVAIPLILFLVVSVIIGALLYFYTLSENYDGQMYDFAANFMPIIIICALLFLALCITAVVLIVFLASPSKAVTRFDNKD
jgi:uncharacterized membrane protein YhaH (DUF805 family)